MRPDITSIVSDVLVDSLAVNIPAAITRSSMVPSQPIPNSSTMATPLPRGASQQDASIVSVTISSTGLMNKANAGPSADQSG
ncbi:hypothetical protein D3C84_1089360 [compost metagenome]